MKLNPSHPRFWSLAIRDRLVKAVDKGIVTPHGLIAHGRGEAFDYILGETTLGAAALASSAATALLLNAELPVLSVNGNTAALVGRDMVKLSSDIPAVIEINLFHRTLNRERTIARHLRRLGAREVLGVGANASQSIPGISSSRSKVDPRGIGSADVVLVPLEDGDRVEALRRAGKKVIAIDLNPLSRTSRAASITIVDNVVRAVPALAKASARMRSYSRIRRERLFSAFDNQRNLTRTIEEMIRYLKGVVKN